MTQPKIISAFAKQNFAFKYSDKFALKIRLNSCEATEGSTHESL